MFNSILAISIGASFGAVGRWLLSLWLNKVFLYIPLGTLIANLLGGYLIGIGFGLFATHPHWSAEWRLLVITGFLGGLTTFSTFSIETVTLLQQERLDWAAMQISLHVVGSLVMTVAGLGTINYLKQ